MLPWITCTCTMIAEKDLSQFQLGYWFTTQIMNFLSDYYGTPISMNEGEKSYFAYLNAIVVGKQFKCKESNSKLRKNLNDCK